MGSAKRARRAERQRFKQGQDKIWKMAIFFGAVGAISLGLLIYLQLTK